MIYYYSASMAGPYHIQHNIPCHDARAIRKRPDGVVVAACADGLGSELFSDVGSRIASRVAVSHCAAEFHANMTTQEVLRLMKVSFVNGYKAVLEEAARMGEDHGQFDTTLCLAIYDGETVWYGQSGDSGLVVRLKTGEYLPVTSQQRDGEGNVYPLCSGPEYWVFGKVEGSVSALMLMTDGIWEQVCHPLLQKEPVKINTRLLRPFTERTETVLKELRKVEAACRSYLQDIPAEQVNDDKTVVVLYNPENPAEAMPDSYYLSPDWEALKQKFQSAIYGEAPEAVQPEATPEETPLSTPQPAVTAPPSVPRKTPQEIPQGG